MADKKRGLGKGLDTMIPKKIEKPEVSKTTIGQDKFMVNINKVEPNRDQPRKTFDEDALLELADSIKQFGIVNPLIVADKGDYYQIIGGERRWRAAKKLGLKEVPVIVKKDLTEQEIAEIALIDNIQREDINPIEEALAYKRLLTEFNLKQDEVAERVSKSRTAVTNSIRLLKLNEKVQQMVVDEKISTGHARAILGVTDPEKQYLIAVKVFDERMSVRETEKLIKKVQAEPDKPLSGNKGDDKLNIIYKDLEEKLKAVIGTKVTINASKSGNKGKIEIDYYSMEELERIMRLLQSIIKE